MGTEPRCRHFSPGAEGRDTERDTRKRPAALQETPFPIPALPDRLTAIDTHCHLDMEDYEPDREQVIAEALLCGVSRIITIGIDLVSSARAVELAARYPGVYATIGIHPHSAAEAKESSFRQLKALAAHPKVAAYGEIGLDFVKKYAAPAKQLTAFRRQVQLARELSLPVIIHDRGAHTETMAVLQQEKPYPHGGIMHCFSGDAALAAQLVDLGFYISIPGIVTFKTAWEMQEVVRQTDIGFLLLETDGPFLAPVPHRGERNRPAFLLYTARKVAELKNLSLEEVVRRTAANAEALFRLN
jgi:TatD DNase family protein